MVTVDGGELGKMMGSKAELLTQTLPPMAAVFVSIVIVSPPCHFLVLGKNPEVVGCQLFPHSALSVFHCCLFEWQNDILA